MSGEELYKAYEEAMLKRGVAVDPWGALDEIDQDAWDEIANDCT